MTNQINGLPVKDAKDKLDVHITPLDIKAGAKKNAAQCAAAIAICKQGYIEARVHVARTFVCDGKKWLRFATPIALRREIVAFDRGGTFEPGDYALNAPSPSMKSGARETRQYIAPKYQPTKGRDVKKRKRHVTTGIRKAF